MLVASGARRHRGLYWAGAGGYFPQLDRVPPLCWGRPWASQVSRGQGRWEVREGKRRLAARHEQGAPARNPPLCVVGPFLGGSGAGHFLRLCCPFPVETPSYLLGSPHAGGSAPSWEQSFAKRQHRGRPTQCACCTEVCVRRLLPYGYRLPPVTWDRIASLEWEGAALECPQS